MKYPSKTSPDGCSERPESLNPGGETQPVSDLIDHGLELCAEWERLAAQQFALLECRQIEALPTVYRAQARLAERFFALEQQWQAVAGALDTPDRSHVGLHARLRQFQAAVARATAGNQRNLIALNTLLLLGGNYETLVSTISATTYNRSGCRAGATPAPAIAVNQEG